MENSIAGITRVLVLVFTLIACFRWYQRRHQTTRVWRSSLTFALIASFCSSLSIFCFAAVNGRWNFYLDAFQLGQLLVFCCAGAITARDFGNAPFGYQPWERILLTTLLRLPRRPIGFKLIDTAHRVTFAKFQAITFASKVIGLRLSRTREPVATRTQLLFGAASGAAIYGAIFVWFTVMNAKRGSLDPQIPDLGWLYSLGVLATFLTAAIGEELIYRVGLNHLIGRFFGSNIRAYWIGSVISSLIWAFTHIGQVDPSWIKISFVFVAGVWLSYLLRRFGALSCVIAHCVWNLLGFLLPFSLPQ